VDFHFVDQAGFEVLLGNVCTTAQSHVFAACSFFGPFKRCFDSVGDEVKNCSTLHLKRTAGVMGENEDSHMKRRILSPPTVPGFVSPRAVPAAKHVAAHNRGPDVLKIFRGDIVIGTGRASFHPMDRAESPRRERPIVEFLAAQWMRDGLVGPGDIAVERHRNVELKNAHSNQSSR
jgi:hypothetical protein